MKQTVEVPPLKSRNQSEVIRKVKLVNVLIQNVETHSTTQLNHLLFAGSFVVAERLGLLEKKKGER